MATNPKIATTENLELFKELLEKDYIKNLSVSGTTITYTKGDGTTGTITTQDTNTDTKVTNTLATTTKAYLTGTTSSSTNTGTQIFDTGVYLSTTAGELVATKFTGALNGNASSATKATQDSAGQQINTTYIKGLSVNGKTITYTKGDGTTGTITTQDTNTTYTTGTASTSGLTKLYTGTGTNTDGTMTQSAIKAALDTKASLASPALTGTPTTPTAGNSVNNTQIANTAFVHSVVNEKIAAADAMIFKGTIGTGGTVTALPNTHSTGWAYKVITAGTFAGQKCEIGDLIVCLTDGTSASDSHWTVIQTNIDGAVTGPASSVDARIAVFNGTTGKVIKDSGYTIGKSVPSNAVFTDTHYTTGLKVGASSSATANAAASNGAVYLNILDNTTVRDSHLIKGAGATTVTSDANGVITITSTDTNTNTTYNAGAGIFLSGTTFSNSGVRSIASGSANGTISVNTNGTAADIAVKGLGSAAYTNSSAYATSGHTHSSVLDSGNNSMTTTFAYSKAGLDTTNWFAAWNDYELRAISPAKVLSTIGAAASSHTHTSSSITGLATVATSGNYNDLSNKPISLPANGGTSSNSNWLNTNSTLSFGASGLNYFNQSTSTTSGATANANPTNDWYHILRMNHANSQGYFVDLAFCFHSDTVAFRRIAAGQEYGWRTLIHDGNIGSQSVAYATKATQDSAGQQINTTYIKGLSVSGTTITYTKGDGTTGTLTTQDTNTDTKVTNTLATTTKAYVTGTTSSTTNTGSQVFDTGVYLDSTAGTLVATTFKTASGIEIY